MVKRRFRHFYEKNFDIFEIYKRRILCRRQKKIEREIAKQEISGRFYVQQSFNFIGFGRLRSYPRGAIFGKSVSN